MTSFRLCLCLCLFSLLIRFRHGGVAPAEAIATWLLYKRLPGDPTRPYLVMSGVCAAPASAESTNSSGIHFPPSFTARTGSAAGRVVVLPLLAVTAWRGLPLGLPG